MNTIDQTRMGEIALLVIKYRSGKLSEAQVTRQLKPGEAEVFDSMSERLDEAAQAFAKRRFLITYMELSQE